MLIAEGVDLDIIEFTDYVKPNLALQDKEPGRQFLSSMNLYGKI